MHHSLSCFGKYFVLEGKKLTFFFKTVSLPLFLHCWNLQLPKALQNHMQIINFCHVCFRLFSRSTRRLWRNRRQGSQQRSCLCGAKCQQPWEMAWLGHTASSATRVNRFAQCRVLFSCYNFQVNIKFTELGEVKQALPFLFQQKAWRGVGVGVLKVTGWSAPACRWLDSLH